MYYERDINGFSLNFAQKFERGKNMRTYHDASEFSTNFKISEIVFEDDKIPDYVNELRLCSPASAEMTFECEINSSLFDMLSGNNSIPNTDSFTVELKTPYKVQIRRHKKKRINKKWAKRYGYITKFKSVKITDVTFKHGNKDFEIIGNGVYVS